MRICVPRANRNQKKHRKTEQTEKTEKQQIKTVSISLGRFSRRCPRLWGATARPHTGGPGAPRGGPPAAGEAPRGAPRVRGAGQEHPQKWGQRQTKGIRLTRGERNSPGPPLI